MTAVETFVFDIVGRILGRLGSLAIEEVGSFIAAKSDLKRLERTLSAIKAVILDAEEQQVMNHEVRDWLVKLKDVVYDIDDALDDFSMETSQHKVRAQEGKSKKVRKFFSSSNPLVLRYKMSRTIKDIREELDSIEKDMRAFHFTTQDTNSQVMTRRRKEQTHSFVKASNVFGRGLDQEKIVRLLVSSNYLEDVSVIPIVGLGGLGKTTLAKLVYNDERVVCNFETRLWICVSDDFDLKILAEKLVKSLVGSLSTHLDMDQLQVCLRDHLKAKKYLLVLDDVWNDDPRRWKDLKDLLSNGAEGSKILATTRSIKVASIMATPDTRPYYLKGLSDDKCLSLFLKCAFRDGHEKLHPRLVEIGKDIVKKCGGVPLAIKTMGSLLYMKKDEEEWKYIESSDTWEIEQKDNDILPILRLSYDHMPSYLKQCFAYCSIFPKDYQIRREELINLWIAQGLIPEGTRSFEDVGNQYFNELLSRSFFQDVEEAFDSEILTCKMHDLVHDLARSVAGIEFSVVNSDTKVASERVRHLLFCKDKLPEAELPGFLLKSKKVRSFTVELKDGPINKPFIDMLMLKFRCLRVLDLRESEFKEFPNSFGGMTHLRYLSVCENRKLEWLPDSVCKLLNLQTLCLLGCQKLRELPKDIGKLRSLRHLYLTSQLTCFPETGLEGLTALQSLSLVSCEFLTTLSEGMQHLIALRELCITRCPMLTSLPRGCSSLTTLKKLSICDCPLLDLSEGGSIERLSSLRSLVIWGVPEMTTFPKRLIQEASALHYVSIRDCHSFELFKWPQSQSSLRKLEVVNCPQLQTLPDGMQHFKSLEEFHIKGCPILSKRCRRKRGLFWQNIAHIPRVYNDMDEVFAPSTLQEFHSCGTPTIDPRTTDEVAPWTGWRFYRSARVASPSWTRW